MLAVAAVIDGEIAGIAAASADSAEMWQIGIDVLPELRGRKIASILTSLISQEIVKRGFLPFYGTAESHIVSSKVAVNAGFAPAWWELFTAGI